MGRDNYHTLRKQHQEKLTCKMPLKYQRALSKTNIKFGEVLGPLVYLTPEFLEVMV